MRLETVKTTVAGLLVTFGVVPALSHSSSDIDQKLVVDDEKEKRESISTNAVEVVDIQPEASASAIQERKVKQKVDRFGGEKASSTSEISPESRRDVGRILNRGKRVGYSMPMGAAARFLTASPGCEGLSGGDYYNCICGNPAGQDFICNCDKFSNGSGEITCTYEAGCFVVDYTLSNNVVTAFTATGCYEIEGTKELLCGGSQCTGDCFSDNNDDFQTVQACPRKESGFCSCTDTTCSNGNAGKLFDCGGGISGTSCDTTLPDGLVYPDACSTLLNPFTSGGGNPTGSPSSASDISMTAAAGAVAACAMMMVAE